ncbi:MAG: VOC family protein [Candidatus Sulfotelmatobacter sp.]
MVQGVETRSGSTRSGSREQAERSASKQVERAGFLPNGNCTLHHLGFVVASISAVAEDFAFSISAQWDGEITHDPIQRVRVTFLAPLDVRNPVYELIEPASDASPVSNFLKKRGGLHHVCYEIDDLEAGLRDARSAGLVIVAEPVPAVAFAGRRIAWICSKHRLLIELLERHKK